jgi:predicted esterase YcpF (UPF0227 family)
MSRPTLIYLHGFESSGRSRKASQMGDYLRLARPDIHYLTPTLPDTPLAAWQAIDALVTPLLDEPLAVLGSSLGGFYATWLAQKWNAPAVVINPAVRPDLSLQRYAGVQTHYVTGEQVLVRPEYFEQLGRYRVSAPDPDRFWLLCAQDDEVLDSSEMVSHYVGCKQTVTRTGGHTFADFAQYIPDILAFGAEKAR